MLRSLLLAAGLLLGVSAPAFAQTQPLKSFGYQSASCTTTPDGATVLSFGATGFWKMGSGSDMALPGSAPFPSGNFFVRKIAVSVPPNGRQVVVGHSGPNGDLVTGFVNPGESISFDFFADAAPFFTIGEYFDVHVNSCVGVPSAALVFWYVLATPPAVTN